MKKYFALLTAFAAVAGLLTSCTSDDELTSNSSSSIDANSIVFSTYKPSASTRSGVTITSINKFTVDAVTNDNKSYFSSVDYIFNNSKNVFESETPYYWPTDGSLSFYAISDPVSKSLDANNVPRYTFGNWSAEKDLVAATVTGGEKEIPYPLNFQHITSQISVSAEAKNKSEELTYKLVSVKMTAPSTGTYSFADVTGGIGSWTIDNSKTSEYSYSSALPISFKQNGKANLSSVYWNILPIHDGNLIFLVEYQVLQNGKIIADYTGDNSKECTVEKPSLLPGKMYCYNLILTRGTNDEITFSLTMKDWEDGTVTTVEPLDPALTYVTYSDGTTQAFDISGTIEQLNNVYLIPSECIPNLKDATSIKIGNKVTKLGNKAFAGCSKLSKIDIPESVQSLGEYTFAGCNSLTEITIPEGVTELPKNLFHYKNGMCYGLPLLRKVNLPSTITKIGEYAFAGCTSLKSIELPASVNEIASYAFLSSCLEEIKLNGPVHLNKRAFQNCDLRSISIPAGSVLETNCFQQGGGKEAATKYNDVTANLKEVTFEGKVTFNGYSLFYGCVNVETINYNSTELPVFGADVLVENRNAISSTTAERAIGHNYCGNGTNRFNVPANATYNEADLDVFTPVLFNSEYCGFTLSKTL